MTLHHYDPAHDDELDDFDSRPSKSQKKRDMDALQALGQELAALSAERLKKLPMPENLLAAILEWQRFSKHEARRRQMQYIGRLMRDVDPQPLQEALDAIKGVSAAENARMHRLERLRERLLEDEQVLGEIADEYPGANLQRLRQLRRNALKEAEQARPPRSFRELFRELRALDQPGEPAEEEQEQDLE